MQRSALGIAAAVAVSASTAFGGGIALAGSPSVSRGAPSLATAGPFLLHEIDEKVHSDYAAAWQTLYPLHQQVAPRDRYIACETASPFPAPLQHIEIKSVHRAPVQVAGSASPVAGAAVRVRVTLQGFAPRDPIVLTHTFHLVAVGSRWTWILSAPSYRAYAAGQCP
jgi:hypothetical protein